MEEKHCGNCLHSYRTKTTNADQNIVYCRTYGDCRHPDRFACDSWAPDCIDEVHEEKVFDVTQLKPSSKRYIFCSIDNKTGEGHLVVKLDLKFKNKMMLPDAIYSMTLQELLDMEDKE